MKLIIIGVALAGFAAFTPLSAQRPSGNQRGSRQDCTNSQSSGSVADIILGRRSASTVGCADNRNQRVNGGGWYEIGNDGNGGTIYERQTRDRNGNIIVQRARRDAYGNMSIISTNSVGNDGTYNNGTYNDGQYNNGEYNNRHGDDGDEDDQGNYQNDRRRGNDNQNDRGNNGNRRGRGRNGNNGHHGEHGDHGND